jgi:hypothetical protein
MKPVNYLSSIENLYITMAIDKNKVIDAIQREYENEQNGDVFVHIFYIYFIPYGCCKIN